LWLVLLPWSLWMRYRSGRARRRPQGWVVRGNAWLLAASLPLFLGTAWLMDRWMRDALRDAALGLLLGTLFGIVSVWLTRFERDARGLAYTPNRWPVLVLTGLVAARVLAGFWRAWRGAEPAPRQTLRYPRSSSICWRNAATSLSSAATRASSADPSPASRAASPRAAMRSPTAATSTGPLSRCA